MKFSHPRYDASENLFMRRALEEVRAKSYDVRFPQFKGRLFVPVDHSLHNGAEISTFETYEEFGEAKIISDYSTELPRVDLKGTDQSQRIKGIGASYGYSLQEVRAAMMAGQPLAQRKANAARMIVEQKIDQLLLLGDSSEGLSGLFTLSNASTYSTPVGAAASKALEDKTADEALKDLNGVVNQVVQDTNGVHLPNALVMPLTSYNYCRDTRMGDGIDGTILQFFLKNNPHIQSVEWSEKLESNAAWTGKRMVAYVKSPDMLQGVIPQEFEQLPPEAKGLQTIVACHARCGGVEAYYPKSVCFADEI